MTPSHFKNIANQRNARTSKRTLPGAPWRDPASAPRDMDIEILSRDSSGLYALPFPCRRVEEGFINARTGALISLPVIGWRVRGW